MRLFTLLILGFFSQITAFPILNFPVKIDASAPYCIDSVKSLQGTIYIYSIPSGTSRMFLLVGEYGMVLVDCGWPGFEWRVKKLMNHLHRNDLRLIVVTHGHFDHYGSAAALHRITGAPIAIHELDEEYMAQGITRLGNTHGWGKIMALLLPVGEFFLQVEKTFADILFEDEFSLKPYGIDGYVLHTPGHTPGSVSVIIGNEIALTGDLLSTSGKKIESQQYYAVDWYLQAHSLILLKSIAPLRSYPSHGNSFIRKDDLFLLKAYINE